MVLGLGAGCDLDRRPTETAPTPTAPDDGDSQLVATVTAELLELAALVARTRADHPGLVPATEHLRALHAAHLELLGSEAGVAPAAPRSPAKPGAALSALRARERRARSQLADWSVAAESGALARLLASMSAGVAQQLAAWPARTSASGS